MGYVYPCAVRNVSDDFNEHKARGSVNPGTDYTCGMGSAVYAPNDGVIVGGTDSISGSGGRMIYLDLDDGNGIDLLHLSSRVRTSGRVAAGTLVAYSGASGNGSNNYYGPHLHISIRNRHGSHTSGSGNFDFDAMMRGQVAPVETGGDDMGIYCVPDATVGLVVKGTQYIVEDGGMVRPVGQFESQWRSGGAGPYGLGQVPITVTGDKLNSMAGSGGFRDGIWVGLEYFESGKITRRDAAGNLTTEYPTATGVGGGSSGGATADQIADAVDAELAPRFDAIPGAVVDEFADRLGGQSRGLSFARNIALVIIGVALVLLALLVPEPFRLIEVGFGSAVAVLGIVLLVAEYRRGRIDSP